MSSEVEHRMKHCGQSPKLCKKYAFSMQLRPSVALICDMFSQMLCWEHEEKNGFELSRL